MALKVDYVTRETLINLRRNLLLSTASVLTVAVSLSMVGAVLFLRFGVDNATARWKNGVEFEIFLKTDPAATADQCQRHGDGEHRRARHEEVATEVRHGLAGDVVELQRH